MSEQSRIILGGLRSVARRVKDRIVQDIILDVRDGKQWGADRIPHGIALVVEKWLGFWYAFLLTIIVGWGGMMLIEAARWASDIPVVINTVPWLVSHIGMLGLIVLFLAGIGMLGVVVVSVARVLLWVRGVSKDYWNQHTPRHPDSNIVPEAPPWPPSEEEMDRVRAKIWRFTRTGSLLFIINTLTLFYLELNYPNQLHAAVSNPALSSAGNVMNAAVWVINVGGLFRIVSSSVSQSWVVYSIFVFVIPGIFLSIAARNLLFLSEGWVRTDIEKAAERGFLGWTGVKLSGPFILFSLWTVAILYQILPG